MKYTQDPDRLLERLIASTRSPRGRFSAAESYKMLQKKLFPNRSRILSLRITAAAAAIALLCVMSWSVYQYMKPIAMCTISTLANRQEVRLPDGTQITLNHYSTLTYPEKFSTGTRKVELSGEAYFEVSKDKEHPFIVETSSINVEVLGTHFNVEAYADDPEVSTTLLEGSVAVSNKSNSNQVILKPNERAIYNKEKNSLIRKVVENTTEEVAWREGKFIFNHLPLQEVAQQLSNSFGIRIDIPDKALQEYRLTARFTNGESLTDILDLLQAAAHFKYTYSQNRKQIIITEPA